MLSPQEMERKILDLEKQLGEALQLQKRIGPSKKENTTLDLGSGRLIIPIKATGGRAKKGELRYNGTYVYVYSGVTWVALT